MLKHVKGGYTFDKYSVALPYNERVLRPMKPAPCKCARSHMALVSQNEYNVYAALGK